MNRKIPRRFHDIATLMALSHTSADHICHLHKTRSLQPPQASREGYLRWSLALRRAGIGWFSHDQDYFMVYLRRAFRLSQTAKEALALFLRYDFSTE